VESVVLQDVTTLEGLGGSVPVTFYQNRDTWLWAAKAENVILVVEVFELNGTDADPTLSIQTGPDAGGPWTTVASWTEPGTYTLFLGREPTYSQAQRVEGYLRWKLSETVNGHAWNACFRVTAVIEPVG